MGNHPLQAQLSEYSTRMPRIPQSGPFWCIPASVENVLKYIGINNLSQEQMVVRYAKKYGKKSLIIPHGSQALTVDPSGLSDQDILRFARHAALSQANFDVFKSIVEESGVLNSSMWELIFVNGLSDQAAYADKLKQHIAGQEPVMIASTNPDGSSHIRVVLAYDSSQLTFYDPAVDEIQSLPYSGFKFNDDMLILKRKQ